MADDKLFLQSMARVCPRDPMRDIAISHSALLGIAFISAGGSDLFRLRHLRRGPLDALTILFRARRLFVLYGTAHDCYSVNCGDTLLEEV